MPRLLWWGRSDAGYSRNRLVLRLLSDLGWQVDFFRPIASPAGFIQAKLSGLRRPDLVWVPCFRQDDIASAAGWAKKRQVPLVIDPLISAYQKQVYERRKWPPEAPRAAKRLAWEQDLFARADVVVADTPAHAAFFQETLQVDADRLRVLYVGAEADLFQVSGFPDSKAPFEIFFYGSFLELQGADVIIKAARKLKRSDVRWTLLGEGDTKPACKKAAAGMKNICFEPWIEYERLPQRLAKAHILLGIFGTTPKADLVIPNKIFQAMAAARPVITRRAAAYRQTLAGPEGADVIGWVPPGDADALAAMVDKWISAADALAARGRKTRQLFDDHFGEDKLKMMLGDILDKAQGKRIWCRA